MDHWLKHVEQTVWFKSLSFQTSVSHYWFKCIFTHRCLHVSFQITTDWSGMTVGGSCYLGLPARKQKSPLCSYWVTCVLVMDLSLSSPTSRCAWKPEQAARQNSHQISGKGQHASLPWALLRTFSEMSGAVSQWHYKRQKSSPPNFSAKIILFSPFGLQTNMDSMG